MKSMKIKPSFLLKWSGLKVIPNFKLERELANKN
jgi:hypothetical protein